MKPPFTLLVAVLAALAFAASAQAAPTKREFIAKGDRLCAQTVKELVPIRERAEAAKSLPQAKQWDAVTSIWTAQIAIQSRFVARFRAIGVPAGDRAAAGLVADLGRGLTYARRVRDSFKTRDAEMIAQAIPAYLRFTLALNRRVGAYGFRVCGRE